MKNLIRRNLAFFIVACSTLLCSLVMLLLIYQVNSERTGASNQLNELKEEIRKLSSCDPYPSEKNIELIRDDINTLELKMFQLEDIFGNIYAAPLSEFIQQLKWGEIQALNKKLKSLGRSHSNEKTIGEIEAKLVSLEEKSDTDFEVEFLKEWKVYIKNRKNAEKQISAGNLLSGFILKQKNYTSAAYKTARATFMSEMQKQTKEHLNDETLSDYILNALGAPISFSKIKTKTIIFATQEEVNNLITPNSVAVPEKQMQLFGEITTVPTDEQIPYLINYSRFLEDFYERLADSRIESIESYNKINGIKGVEDNNFLTLRYQVVITASQESLRHFLNSLQEAYKDNRVYIVRALELSTINNSSQDLPPYIKESARLYQPRILLGASDMIRASIVIDYVISKRKNLNI